MKKEEKRRDDRPLAYPLPTETDKQLKDQPEYIDQEPNEFEKTISDIPAGGGERNSEEGISNKEQGI